MHLARVTSLIIACCSVSEVVAVDQTALTWSGWVDATAGTTWKDQADDPATAKNESAATTRFAVTSLLRASWTVGDHVSATVATLLSPDTTSTDNSNLDVGEAYVSWQVSKPVSVRMGKYYNHIGWLGTEAPDWYTVNVSPIGYIDAMGNNVLGAGVYFSDPERCPWFGSLHVTNGYFTASDAQSPGYVSTPNPHRENSDLGFGACLARLLPGDLGNVHFDAAFDAHSDNRTVAGGDRGGHVWLGDINATLTPGHDLTIGLEVLMQHFGEGRMAAGEALGVSERRQGLAMINWGLTSMAPPCPMSVTLMYQHVDAREEADLNLVQRIDNRRDAVMMAWLTNPTGTRNFALNAELAWWQEHEPYAPNATTGVPTVTDAFHAASITIEGLVKF